MCIDEALQFISFTGEIIERLLHASDLLREHCRLLAGTFQVLEDTLAFRIRGNGVSTEDVFEGGVHGTRFEVSK
jgi:hypothetical protein